MPEAPPICSNPLQFCSDSSIFALHPSIFALTFDVRFCHMMAPLCTYAQSPSLFALNPFIFAQTPSTVYTYTVCSESLSYMLRPLYTSSEPLYICSDPLHICSDILHICSTSSIYAQSLSIFVLTSSNFCSDLLIFAETSIYALTPSSPAIITLHICLRHPTVLYGLPSELG